MKPPFGRSQKLVFAVVLLVSACFFTLKVTSLRKLRHQREKIDRVHADVRLIDVQLEQFKRETGDYPASQRHLPLHRAKDPWGTDYIYRCPGKHRRDGYDLFSAGADLTPDTLDDEWGEL